MKTNGKCAVEANTMLNTKASLKEEKIPSIVLHGFCFRENNMNSTNRQFSDLTKARKSSCCGVFPLF